MGAPPSVYPKIAPRSFPVTSCPYCGGTHQREHCPNCGAPAITTRTGFVPRALYRTESSAPIHKYGDAYHRSFFDYLYPASEGPPGRPQDTVTP